MKHADNFVPYLMEMLAPWAPVSARRLFGSYGLYRAGRMFGLVSDSRLFLKDGFALRALSAGRTLPPFVYERQTPTRGSRTVALGYVAVPEDVLDDPDLLGQWAAAAYADQ